MTYIIAALILLVSFWLIIKLRNYSQKKDEYNRDSSNYNRSSEGYDKGIKAETPKAGKPNIFAAFLQAFKSTDIAFRLPSTRVGERNNFDPASVAWCAIFLEIDEQRLKEILEDVREHYAQFRIKKRSTGYRTISAPSKELLAIQRIIYMRILLPANIHIAATGFRRGRSIVDNANIHLGKKNVLKVDIKDFFGSIKFRSVKKMFANMGYPLNIAHILGHLCCLRRSLPQGAPTSPALSNIIAYGMDSKLTALAKEHGLTYTRYADDLTFSGDEMDKNLVLNEVNIIVGEYKLALNRKKTHFMPEGKRKIITGISVSSGEKLTIPKSKKREIRKNVHYILTNGLADHQKYIHSNDPAYLNRLIGYLNFWLMVEPNNQYAKNSIEALSKLK